MMVITRSKKTVKSSIEQPSRDVASPGDGNSDPRRHHVPQQANAEVEGKNNSFTSPQRKHFKLWWVSISKNDVLK